MKKFMNFCKKIATINGDYFFPTFIRDTKNALSIFPVSVREDAHSKSIFFGNDHLKILLRANQWGGIEFDVPRNMSIYDVKQHTKVNRLLSIIVENELDDLNKFQSFLIENNFFEVKRVDGGYSCLEIDHPND